jgi:hypothetical protein
VNALSIFQEKLSSPWLAKVLKPLLVSSISQQQEETLSS